MLVSRGRNPSAGEILSQLIQSRSLRDRVLTVFRHVEGGYLLAQEAVPGEKVRLEPFLSLEIDTNPLFGVENAPS